MKILVLYDYSASPGRLATQGELLYRGLKEMGGDAYPVMDLVESLGLRQKPDESARKRVVEPFNDQVVAMRFVEIISTRLGIS